MKKTASEMLLILILSLCLSLLYNMISPSGLRILPKKKTTTNGPQLTTGMAYSPKFPATTGGVQ